MHSCALAPSRSESRLHAIAAASWTAIILATDIAMQALHPAEATAGAVQFIRL
jgi:hypothetical protein